MLRKIMRNAARRKEKTAVLKQRKTSGMVRAGMHQKSEHAWHQARLSENEHHEETVEEALDLPEALEELIPPEELTEPAAEAAAEVDSVIVPDEELLEKISDPDPEEEASAETEEEAQMSLCYESFRPDFPQPVTGGVDCEPRELIYDPGDGSPKPIGEAVNETENED